MARRTNRRAERRLRRGRSKQASGLLQPPAKATLGQRIRTWFLAGVLTTAPLAITLFIAWQFVDFVDTTVKTYWPSSRDAEDLLLFAIPGVGVVIVFVILVLIGMLTAGLVGRTLTRMAESVVGRIPAVRSIYSALKQIMETVLSSQSDAFREVVLIEYPRKGIWAIAFLTGPTRGEVKDALGDQLQPGTNPLGDEMVNVFVPTTPNPTSGFFLFLPERDVYHLDMTVEDGIKMVVSAGIVTPPRPDEVAKAEAEQLRADANADPAPADKPKQVNDGAGRRQPQGTRKKRRRRKA